MPVYVLVGGGWLGGWCWQRVARRLREEGHYAYPATLTGLGERVHLASPEVDLESHITDVVNLIEFEDLNDVVLLGHSYAGLVTPDCSPTARSSSRRSRPTPGGISSSRWRSRAMGGGSPCRHKKSWPPSAA
jgi:hypothetical protein